MNLYIVIAVVVSLALSHGAAYLKGSNDTATRYELEVKEAEVQSYKIAELKQGKANERANRLEASRRTIQSKLDAANERLRNRPERMPEVARANCTGTSGAELSRPDSAFLEREAARADRIRAALDTCYQHVDAQ